MPDLEDAVDQINIEVSSMDNAVYDSGVDTHIVEGLTAALEDGTVTGLKRFGQRRKFNSYMRRALSQSKLSKKQIKSAEEVARQIFLTYLKPIDAEEAAQQTEQNAATKVAEAVVEYFDINYWEPAHQDDAYIHLLNALENNQAPRHGLVSKVAATISALALCATLTVGTTGCDACNDVPNTDVAAQVDGGSRDIPIDGQFDEPAVGSPSSGDDPEPAQCSEIRFNHNYNSTSFVDRANAPTQLENYLRTLVDAGQNTVYITGFASVENRGDTILNDAPYNLRLAERRARRVDRLVTQIAERNGWDLTTHFTGAYGETAALGTDYTDNRFVVVGTEPSFDPDANATTAARLNAHSAGDSYGFTCQIQPEQAQEPAPQPTPQPTPQPAPQPDAGVDAGADAAQPDAGVDAAPDARLPDAQPAVTGTIITDASLPDAARPDATPAQPDAELYQQTSPEAGVSRMPDSSVISRDPDANLGVIPPADAEPAREAAPARLPGPNGTSVDPSGIPCEYRTCTDAERAAETARPADAAAPAAELSDLLSDDPTDGNLPAAGVPTTQDYMDPADADDCTIFDMDCGEDGDSSYLNNNHNSEGFTYAEVLEEYTSTSKDRLKVSELRDVFGLDEVLAENPDYKCARSAADAADREARRELAYEAFTDGTSVREIAECLDCSTSTIYRDLNKMREAEYDIDVQRAA